jgi:carbonic anhydrase
VAPEIVFDQSLGALFVCGVAGNLPTPEVIASLEYGVAVLGCKAILIMGHSGCGAVTAAMEHRHDPSELPGSLPHLIGQIVPVCMQPEGEVSLEAAIANNAKAGAQQLLRGSHIISDAVGAGDVGVYAGVQDVASGRFSLVE